MMIGRCIGVVVASLGGFAIPVYGQCSPSEVIKRIASDGALNANYAIAVGISNNTAIVGAWGATTPGGTFAGAAYVLVRNGPSWIDQSKLIALDGAANDSFGISVAISGDTAVIGSFLDDTASGVDAGSAYVFVRSGTIWTQQAKLTALDAATNDGFGVSVAIDGDTIIVGAENDDNAGGIDAGSAYVFSRSGVVWTQQAKLTASDGAAGDRFGYSVSLSNTTAVVGAQSDDTPAGATAGSAYVFTRCGALWSQQAKLTASDGADSDIFGVSVSISNNTIVVGAYGDDTPGGANAGSAYVFTRSGPTWVQQAKLTAGDGAAEDRFGVSVAVSGETIVVGSYNDDPPGGSNAGTAYLFTRSSNPCTAPWVQQTIIAASDGAANDAFGYSVALSQDSAIIGAFSADTAGGANAGAAYFFNLNCDNDSDGVINSIDECPGNAPGLQVDPAGRPLRDCNHDCIVNAADVQCIVNEMLSQ